jgi:hypothetical protein
MDETALNYEPLAIAEGECIYPLPGCTDETAVNYNPDATEDDGSCISCTDNSIALSLYDSYGDGWGSATISISNSEYTHTDALASGSESTTSLCIPSGCYDIVVGGDVYDEEISFALEGVFEETVIQNAAEYDFVAGYATFSTVAIGGECVLGCTDETAVNYNDAANYDDGSCAEPVPGCTDSNADNFDPNASVDDGSCTYCGDFTALLLGTSDASAAGSADGSVQATGQGGSSNYDVQVYDANQVPQNPFALAAGDYTVVVTDVTTNCTSELAITIGEPTEVDPCDAAVVPTGLVVDNIIHNRVVFNWDAPAAAPSYYMIRYRAVGASQWTVMRAGPETANAFTGTSRTRYFHEPATTYQWSIRARVVGDDLATVCQSPWSANAEYTTLPTCANLENLSVDNVEANWVTFFADAPDASWGVWQSKGKMREAGANAYRYVNGGADGSISGVLKGNFTASTDYEWHTKAWCTANVDENGNPDPMYHSGWGEFSAFSTEAACDKLPTNLTTSAGNNANTAVTMSWDTPESGAPDHYFLEMTNLTTGAVYEWNYQDGNSNSRTKYGQNPGDEISWRIRGACGTNGTSWATIFTQPVTFTLGGARLENSSVANLDVYPNPSRDIFNVTFTSEEAQTMTVNVVNMIGEEIFTEELTDFVGQYTQVIDMNTQPKGVYFLEITTLTGGINKKIVLQ